MKMKSQIKDDVSKVKMKHLILKSNVLTVMVLVSLILNTQIGTSLRRLETKLLRIYLRYMPISYSFCRSAMLYLMVIHYQQSYT